ncbi:hypothetical protein HMPREF9374_2442 [Desmospora sp. 8437]|nr:hypothetical protein HMPREF9374_2442 [Desmospora sp. 8437]
MARYLPPEVLFSGFLDGVFHNTSGGNRYCKNQSTEIPGLLYNQMYIQYPLEFAIVYTNV